MPLEMARTAAFTFRSVNRFKVHFIDTSRRICRICRKCIVYAGRVNEAKTLTNQKG